MVRRMTHDKRSCSLQFCQWSCFRQESLRSRENWVGEDRHKLLASADDACCHLQVCLSFHSYIFPMPIDIGTRLSFILNSFLRWPDKPRSGLLHFFPSFSPALCSDLYSLFDSHSVVVFLRRKQHRSPHSSLSLVCHPGKVVPDRMIFLPRYRSVIKKRSAGCLLVSIRLYFEIYLVFECVCSKMKHRYPKLALTDSYTTYTGLY